MSSKSVHPSPSEFGLPRFMGDDASEERGAMRRFNLGRTDPIRLEGSGKREVFNLFKEICTVRFLQSYEEIRFGNIHES